MRVCQNDKSYTRIVATKAVEIAMDDIAERLKEILLYDEISNIKDLISEIINE